MNTDTRPNGDEAAILRTAAMRNGARFMHDDRQRELLCFPNLEAFGAAVRAHQAALAASRTSGEAGVSYAMVEALQKTTARLERFCAELGDRQFRELNFGESVVAEEIAMARAALASQPQGVSLSDDEIARKVAERCGYSSVKEMVLEYAAHPARNVGESELRSLAAPGQEGRAVAQYLQPEDLAALQRFYETCEDNEPYDVPKERMKRLNELGAVHWCGGSRYSITAFGTFILDLLPEGWERLPLRTHAEHDARVNEQMFGRSRTETVGTIAHINGQAPSLTSAVKILAAAPTQEVKDAEGELEKLKDPTTVHLAMLRGQIGKISMSQCAHVHGEAMVQRWNAFDKMRSAPSSPEVKDAEGKDAERLIEEFKHAWALCMTATDEVSGRDGYEAQRAFVEQMCEGSRPLREAIATVVAIASKKGGEA